MVLAPMTGIGCRKRKGKNDHEKLYIYSW